MKTLLKRIIYAVLPPRAVDWFKVRIFFRIFDKFQNANFPESPIFARYLKPGYTVIDVGANIGLVTKLILNMVGPTGKVHTFEPVPYTFDILRRNIASTGAKNVVCYDMAISDRDGEASIVVPTYHEMPDVRFDNSGSLGRVRNYYAAHIAIEGVDRAPERNIATVPVRSLDSLFAADPARISLIKCDAEGFELQCMLGAKTILTRDRPVLFIELCSDPDEQGSPMWQLIEFLSGLGYSPYLFKDGKLQTRPAGMFVHDLFFLTEAQYASVAK